MNPMILLSMSLLMIILLVCALLGGICIFLFLPSFTHKLRLWAIFCLILAAIPVPRLLGWF